MPFRSRHTLVGTARGCRYGVDFSPHAITLARELTAELAFEASFVCSDVYELTEHLRGRFDIVFASYGVLCWLPDLDRWAQLVARFLTDGGFFYLVDGHPVGVMLDEQDGKLVVVEPYFDVGPVEVPGGRMYADPETVLTNAPSLPTRRHTSGSTRSVMWSARSRLRVFGSSFCTSSHSRHRSGSREWCAGKTLGGGSRTGTTCRSCSRSALASSAPDPPPGESDPAGRKLRRPRESALCA